MNSPSNPAKSLVKLNERSLGQLSDRVRLPRYDRSTVTPGIVHIGVGGFHRAHQALYIDNYLEQNPGSDWGICGVGLLEFDQRMRDALVSQDCLYTLVERSPAGDNARVIGSITQYLFAPENREAVIETLADLQCRIVTLTITEGGYYVVEGTGEFDVNHPTIQHDLQHPNEPHGVYGFLTAALERRRQRGITPFTVLSCDNIQGNGDMVGRMLTSFADLQNPDLSGWIRENVAFPNCMVDRITPATAPGDLQMVADQFDIDDAWPVVAEPFLQWVVEDRFSAGRPDWESVGVQMTDDVHPYEMMKIRLLNTSHLLLGYLGSLKGYTYAHEAMADDQIRQAIERLMDEVTPTLRPVPGIDVSQYKQTLVERFSNPKIQDQLARLCLNSSAKLPKWALGSLREQLEQSGPIDHLSLTIAAWFRYLNGNDDQGHAMAIDDPMADTLTERAKLGGTDPMPLLSLTELFGDLPQSARFVEAVTQYLHQLHELGTQATLAKLLEAVPAQ
ncbi:mannitol dehydrogenase family protein [Phormidium tenue]|uniref:Mannitol-1-phosphate 5-dehydrogenase n=1 Tax=Phormidium tenue NIES-30 TaxID=549789 RepID=A0A1U7J4H8_9CYAN|nr:mannitol dehydrogenase family protein [Phormidium tenue]MBD2232890.1 mannitol dehydrogenase family protein [Phormidium tenue FACHB-1052]OKH47430.1 mannitol dehydrogenase [Phormidium tenue NIES-30]